MVPTLLIYRGFTVSDPIYISSPTPIIHGLVVLEKVLGKGETPKPEFDSSWKQKNTFVWEVC
ncbi:unnamed protein product [Arabidopsis halleri]